MVLVLFSTKVLFFVHVNQSFSCIRSCRTDLLSIVFSVFFAHFLSHLHFFVVVIVFGKFSVRVY